jgi:hypothetical protein
MVSTLESVLQLRFSSVHDFSRAVSEPKSVRLQPLRDGICSRDTDSSALNDGQKPKLPRHALAPMFANERKMKHGEKFRRHLRSGMPLLPG